MWKLEDGARIDGSRERDKDIGSRLEGCITESDATGSYDRMENCGMGLNDVLDFVAVKQLDIDVDTVGFGCFGATLLDSGVQRVVQFIGFGFDDSVVELIKIMILRRHKDRHDMVRPNLLHSLPILLQSLTQIQYSTPKWSPINRTLDSPIDFPIRKIRVCWCRRFGGWTGRIIRRRRSREYLTDSRSLAALNRRSRFLKTMSAACRWSRVVATDDTIPRFFMRCSRSQHILCLASPEDSTDQINLLSDIPGCQIREQSLYASHEILGSRTSRNPVVIQPDTIKFREELFLVTCVEGEH
jgi:hypothetical protein